jgi:hypothetical protein
MVLIMIKQQTKKYFEQMRELCLMASQESNNDGNHSFPFNRAQMAAYQDWINYNNNSSNYYECDDLPWDDEIPDYVQVIHDAGVYEVAVTDHSSNLMKGLHVFKRCGYEIVSLCEVIRHEKRWNGTQEMTYLGILLRAAF